MNNVFQGPGRGVLVLFLLWAVVGQHVFIHHLGGSDLDRLCCGCLGYLR